jgi:hypothetical protein
MNAWRRSGRERRCASETELLSAETGLFVGIVLNTSNVSIRNCTRWSTNRNARQPHVHVPPSCTQNGVKVAARWNAAGLSHRVSVRFSINASCDPRRVMGFGAGFLAENAKFSELRAAPGLGDAAHGTDHAYR